MERPFEPRGLLLAALSAVAAALLARELGLAGAALAVGAAAVLCACCGRAGPWLLAVPAALAAVELPQAPLRWPRPGPVWIEADVLPGVRLDPLAGETVLVLRPVRAPGHRVRCVVRGVLRALPGDRIRGPARALTPPLDAGAPALLQAEAGALRVARGPPSFARVTEACRLALQRALLAAVPGENGVLLCHLVLGGGPALPPDLVDAHRATGLSHLLAVSGAHASMLGWMLGLLYAATTGRTAPGSRRYRRFCALFLLLYGGITGMEPPVFRALVAFFLFLFAHALGRRVTVCAALSLPALLTAVFAPRDLLTASFCLSYAAVLGLALAGAFHARSWTERYVRMPLYGSLWATLLTMPLTLHYFGQVAPWTIAGTPVLAPLAGLMLAGGLLIALLAVPAAPLAAALAGPLDAATALYCSAVRALGELPFAPVSAVGRPDVALVVGCGLCGAALLLARPRRAAVAALCLGLSLPYFVPPPRAAPRLELVAVGHGQACLAHLPGGASVLVDCGRLGDGEGPAARAARALAPRATLDLLVLTHPHFDHCGGALPLQRRVRIARVALPAEMVETPLARALGARGAALVGIARGARVEVEPGVHVARPALPSLDANDQSLWVTLELGAFRALVTGDPGEDGVAAWLRSPMRGPADVLVLPHHGRVNARAGELLRAVAPRLALVSNRAADGWSDQARTALACGIRVLETGRVGTIRIDAGPPPRITTQTPLRLR